MLLTLLGKEINIDDRAGHYSSAWNALLGGKVTKEIDGRYRVAKASSNSTCPNHLTTSFSTVLKLGDTPDLAVNKAYRVEVIQEILTTV